MSVTGSDAAVAAGDSSLSVPVIDLSGSLSFRSASTSHLAEQARSALAAATAQGATHVLMVSSAIVYGAWENSAVPLEETRTLRPRPEVADAVALGAAEALVEQWRREAPGRTATILRPVTVVDPGRPNSMVDALVRVLALTPSQAPAPAQFLDREDLASAVQLCRMERPDAVLNVAPPGMISGERLRELAPRSAAIPVPGAIAEVIESWRASVSAGTGALAHVRHPWVVSADRLRALGWTPAVSNEEAFVAGTTQGWFASLNAKRRQEVALLAATLGAVAVAAAVVSWWRRSRRR